MLNLTAYGNLGRDPDLKQVGDTQVASFDIGVRTGKDETTWIGCSIWGKRAEVAMQYLKKGSKITVNGSGRVRIYQKKDGTEGKALDVRVNDFTLPAREAAPAPATSKAEFDF